MAGPPSLGAAIGACAAPPRVWLNSSTGTIYRDARDRPQDEATGEIGQGFSVAVARAWEHELFAAPTSVRRIALRTAIVLGLGGALNPMINLARLGAGGPMGDGGQMVSWVHVDDVYRAIRHLADCDVSGPVNLAAPAPVTNAEFMAAVRARFGPGKGLPMPARLLRVGAVVIRTEPELVLKSRWVEPRVLLESGFAFAHPGLGGALDAIAARTPRGLLPVQLG